MVSKISSTIGSPLYELLQCRIDWEDGGAGQSRSRADLVQDQIIIAIPDFSFDQNKIDRGQAKLTLKTKNTVLRKTNISHPLSLARISAMLPSFAAFTICK